MPKIELLTLHKVKRWACSSCYLSEKRAVVSANHYQNMSNEWADARLLTDKHHSSPFGESLILGTSLECKIKYSASDLIHIFSMKSLLKGSNYWATLNTSMRLETCKFFRRERHNFSWSTNKIPRNYSRLKKKMLQYCEFWVSDLNFFFSNRTSFDIKETG